jgi:penicillin-insensitive murein endopeptidase
MLKGETRVVDPNKFTPAHAAIIKIAAKQPETARIFVHPAIKKALCDSAGNDRGWLRKVRPWWGHYYHFHVRISCPSGSSGCTNQSAPPAGDGCGKELDWWLSDAPWKPSPKPPKPKPPLTMADLPGECRTVVNASAGGVTAASAAPVNVPVPRPRP